VREISVARNSRPQHQGHAAPCRAPAPGGHRRRVTAPHPHPIGVGNCFELDVTELDEVAHPRPLEAAQNRMPRAIVIDKNKLRRVHTNDKYIVRSEIAVKITPAMKSRDFLAECAQQAAFGGEGLIR
jgi:hypothetical protein